MNWYKMTKFNNWDLIHNQLKESLRREPKNAEIQEQMLKQDFDDINKEGIKPIIVAKKEDKLTGGNTDKMDVKDFEKSQIERGKKVEMEHTDNPDIAEEITMDHLEEHEDYYVGLEHMEKALEEIEKRKNEDN